MKTVQCLIIDDEPLAREIIASHLEKVPEWNVLETCKNAEEGYEALLKFDIDVLFLDIEMPIISGVDFLNSLKKPPLVVFTTAYSKYALKGFDLNIIDYLLKPITLNRFLQTIDKLKEKLNTKELPSLKSLQSKSFFVKYNGKLLNINFEDIIYVKAEKDFSSIVTKTGKLLVSMHLKLLNELLPKTLFTRIHRSYIIADEKIISIYGNMLHIGQTEIPIGSKHKGALLKKLNIK